MPFGDLHHVELYVSDLLRSKAFYGWLLGPLSALFFLTNWVAHDYLHLRQVTKVKFYYLDALTDATLQYAGEW